MTKPYFKLRINDKGQEVVDFFNIPDDIECSLRNFVDYLHNHNPEEYEKLTSHIVKTSPLQIKEDEW